MALTSVTILASLPVSAATPPNVSPQVSGKTLADLQAQRQALFQKILHDPGNVELTLQYAQLSSQVGDLEGAISALERLLIMAPNVAQVTYQLGVLYMRLGAYGQASTDFKLAIAAPDITPELKASAERYIAIADKQVIGDYFIGSFVPGVRYQTNANGGIAGNQISINGIPVTIDSAGMAAPDFNAFISASIHGSHDLQDQGDRLNLDANFYWARYKDQTQLDTIAGSVQAGPVIALDRIGLKGSTLGLYGIASAVELGGSPYLYVLGAGGVVTLTVGPGSLASRLEYRREFYQDTPDRPSASDLSGARVRATESAQVQAGDHVKLYSSAYLERKEAVLPGKTDWEAGVSAGTTLAFGAVNSQLPPITLDMQLGLLARMFDAPDSPFAYNRFDEGGYVSATVNVPVTEHVAATATASYSKQLSNVDLYVYDDASLSLALNFGF